MPLSIVYRPRNGIAPRPVGARLGSVFIDVFQHLLDLNLNLSAYSFAAGGRSYGASIRGREAAPTSVFREVRGLEAAPTSASDAALWAARVGSGIRYFGEHFRTSSVYVNYYIS